MDLVGDTYYAIKDFLKFGYDSPIKYDKLGYDNLGEKLLRLYGVLNAVYLQQSAILNLYTIFKLDNSKEFKKKIYELKILKIRHMIAAHSMNCLDENREKYSYVISQVDLCDYNLDYMNNHTNENVTVNLLDLIDEYLNLMINTMDKIFEKMIGTIYKTAPDKKRELYEKLEELRLEKDEKIFNARSGEVHIRYISGNIKNGGTKYA
ncbi:MAG: hypothetical protein JRJ49_10610 [Deltaproteobacteria bacterium]|nr:hypothetical protein [Deltaproteobacteria bacterium]